ncbi:hypothetical protein GUJ93_ZPchr0012g20454 [Zizania palustris]|uniref:Uncharacterized protein n=1 Tax=Zizania palustris TaxID=103762 RepID=A0A8J6BUW1_ZIZPA|nr:hypothetical protein GUJ93_ZPchr0012g20454 [Zizania palustris]
MQPAMRRQGSCEFNSSIALLQERFRNLQKVREMREGREQLLQIMATTTAAGATTTPPAAPAAASAASPSSGEQPRWFSHTETEQLVRRPSSRPVQRADHVGEAGVQPPAVSVGRAAGLAVHSSGCRSDVEVDTSLHL